MLYTVIVSFGQNSEYEFKIEEDEVKSATRDDASQWLHREYETLDCAPRNPLGKVLLLDIILDVAKYGGEARFAARDEWARHFAWCCTAVLKRDVRVDVVNLVVG